MRKYTYILLFLLITTVAYAASTTTNYSLYKPAVGDKDWGALVNTNFDTIDTQMKANADDIDTNDAATALNTNHRTDNTQAHSDYLINNGNDSTSGTITASGFIGNLTGQADTVATITGLAPDTATTQATQPNITSLGTLTSLNVSGNVGIGTSVPSTELEVDGTTTTEDIAVETYIDITPTEDQTHSEGRMFYDSDDDVFKLMNAESNVTLDVGEENWTYVRNSTGSTITNMSAVYNSGSTGVRTNIMLSQADSASTALVLGLATHDIENNTDGYVTTFGRVKDVDTSGGVEAWSAGDEIYLSATTAGALTNVEPTAPNFIVLIGTVEVAHATQGVLLLNNLGIDYTDGVVLNSLHVNNDIITDSNIGIGTSAPSGKLDIEGGDVYIGTGTLTNASASDDLSVTGNIEFDGTIYGDGSGLTGIGGSISGLTDNYITRADGATSIQNSAVFATDAGLIGIGTSVPSGVLDVEGGDVYIGTGSFDNPTVDEDLYVTGVIESDATVYGSTFVSSGTGIAQLNQGLVVNNASGSSSVYDFQVKSANVSNMLFVDSSLDVVGVGTSAPSGSYELDVDGSVNFTGTLYEDGVAFSGSQWTTDGSDIYFATGNVGIGTTATTSALIVDGTAGGDVKFNTDQLFLEGSNGYLGLGTSVPTSQLDLTGGIKLHKVTADPCGAGFPEATLFWNDTSNYTCVCDGTNDVQVSDGTTACF